MSMKQDIYTQQTFSKLMKAMSRPGNVYNLSLREGDAPFMPILLTLLDNEVTFAVIGQKIATEDITLATGSNETTIEEADYVLVFGGESAGAVLRTRRGDLRYPDKGATIIYLVKSVKGDGITLRLKGPGIKGEQLLSLDGFSESEVRDIKAANSDFPLGIDCIFIDSDARTASVPRSTHLEVA